MTAPLVPEERKGAGVGERAAKRIKFTPFQAQTLKLCASSRYQITWDAIRELHVTCLRSHISVLQRKGVRFERELIEVPPPAGSGRPMPTKYVGYRLPISEQARLSYVLEDAA